MPPRRKNPEARLPYPKTVVEIPEAMNESCLEIPDCQIDLPGYQYDIAVHGLALHIIIHRLHNARCGLLPPYRESGASICDYAG
jgi:hypothetical protein